MKINLARRKLQGELGREPTIEEIAKQTGLTLEEIVLATEAECKVESIYASVAILLQGIYGIAALMGPTSLFLILCLTYFDIPYTTWLRYIWRFILGIIIVVGIVTALTIVLVF